MSAERVGILLGGEKLRAGVRLVTDCVRQPPLKRLFGLLKGVGGDVGILESGQQRLPLCRRRRRCRHHGLRPPTLLTFGIGKEAPLDVEKSNREREGGSRLDARGGAWEWRGGGRHRGESDRSVT